MEGVATIRETLQMFFYPDSPKYRSIIFYVQIFYVQVEPLNYLAWDLANRLDTEEVGHHLNFH